MPLSEHEQRLLDQIERALYAEDPKFASAVRHTDLRSHFRRRMWRGGALFAIGFVLLLAGLPTELIPLSVAGFVVMLFGLMYLLTSYNRLRTSRRPGSTVVGGLAVAPTSPTRSPRVSRGPRGPRGTGPSRRPKGPRGSIVARLEERWRRRWDERGR